MCKIFGKIYKLIFNKNDKWRAVAKPLIWTIRSLVIIFWQVAVWLFYILTFFNRAANLRKQIVFTLYSLKYLPGWEIDMKQSSCFERQLLWPPGRATVRSVAASAAVCKTLCSGYQWCHFHCGCTCPCYWALFVYPSCDRYCSPHASVHKANSSWVRLIVFEAQEEESLRGGALCCDHHRWLIRRSLMAVW